MTIKGRAGFPFATSQSPSLADDMDSHGAFFLVLKRDDDVACRYLSTLRIVGVGQASRAVTSPISSLTYLFTVPAMNPPVLVGRVQSKLQGSAATNHRLLAVVTALERLSNVRRVGAHFRGVQKSLVMSSHAGSYPQASRPTVTNGSLDAKGSHSGPLLCAQRSAVKRTPTGRDLVNLWFVQLSFSLFSLLTATAERVSSRVGASSPQVLVKAKADAKCVSDASFSELPSARLGDLARW